MSGYRAYRKIFTLKFDDPQLTGLEVRVSSVSMGQLMEVAEQADMAHAGAGLARVRELLAMFVDNVRGWNLEHETTDDNFTPTEISFTGLMQHEPGLVLAMTLAWYQAMTDVPESLGKGSTSGGTSVEASIPMAPL